MAEELRRRNQYEHNESNYNLYKERFENLKFELNISLYNTIGRYRKEYEQQHGTGTFFYDTISTYFDKRLCTQLKRLLIRYNYVLTRLCKKNTFICYYILTEAQQNDLFDIIINHHNFVLYALLQIEERNGQNLCKEYKLRKEAFDNFENNMKQAFRIDFSFKEKYKDLTLHDG